MKTRLLNHEDQTFELWRPDFLIKLLLFPFITIRLIIDYTNEKAIECAIDYAIGNVNGQ